LEKLLVLKNYLGSKITWMEKTTCTENFLDSKIDWMERTSIEKLL
jgi:hypothetical protein